MKVSIITVTFNSARTLHDTLNSVLKQTYMDIEHIIIDGASKDDTLKIVREFSHISKIISEPDKGIYDAMNKGIQLASGDVIGILNSDDVFSTEIIISEIAQIFKENEDIDAVYGNICYFKTGEENKAVRFWQSKPYYKNFFENGEIPPHPSLFVRKKVYDDIGLYKPHYKIAADHEFMLRMLKIHKYKSFYLDKTIVKMREGGVSTSGFGSYITSTKELIQVWKENNMKYPKRLFVLRPLKKIKQLIFK